MSEKYAIIIPDGAADEPLDMFDGKTVIEAAHTPNMDRISKIGKQGTVLTVPEDMAAGSDVAQMSLLGYDPTVYYNGRAPIEAVAMGVELDDNDWIFRCNLVTVADGKMADHSAGHISNKEGAKLIDELNEILADEHLQFHKGISYRHLLVIKDTDFSVTTYPPHDYIGTAVEKILPRGKGSQLLIDLMSRSKQLFAEHEINRVRADLGENQVSSIWLWGEGKKIVMDSFEERFGLKGAAITAVDLARGLARLIGFDLIEVEGATGFADTNYEGKGEAAIEALKDHDIVVVHIEAPDEASHQGNPALKKQTIENIDKHIVGPVLDAIQGYDKWRIMVLPDHPTPVMTQAHSPEPVPFAMAGTDVSGILHKSFGERNARESGFWIEKGSDLMEYFLKS